MFMGAENIPIFMVMSVIIFVTIFVVLRIFWEASTHLVDLLILAPSPAYIDDQEVLITSENETFQEEMVVFDVENQLGRY